jgi:hypothetical protein
VNYLEKMDDTVMHPPTATIKGLLKDCPHLGTDYLFTEWREKARAVYRSIILGVSPALASSDAFKNLVDTLCVKAMEESFTAELAHRSLQAATAAAKFKVTAASKQRTPDTQVTVACDALILHTSRCSSATCCPAS